MPSLKLLLLLLLLLPPPPPPPPSTDAETVAGAAAAAAAAATAAAAVELPQDTVKRGGDEAERGRRESQRKGSTLFVSNIYKGILQRNL